MRTPFRFFPPVLARLLFLTMTLPSSSLSLARDDAPAPTATAILGGGCFWCIEAVYERLPGVQRVVSGYAGGRVPNPTYEQVCTGTTGHAEVARIEYDPAVLSYDRLLEVFFAAHDPTTLNRQGADEGTQYRSVIFFSDEAQHQAALRARTAAQAHCDDPIVTQIEPLTAFYPAETHHQDYYRRNPNQGYCTYVIRPKLKKLEAQGLLTPGQ